MYFSSRTRKRSGRGSLLSQPSSLLLSRRLVFFNLCVRRRVCTDKSERESSPAITPRYNRSECGKKLSRRSDSSINTNEIHQTIHEQTLKTNFPSICGEIFVEIVRCSASYLFSLDLSKKKGRIFASSVDEKRHTTRVSRCSTFTLLLRIPSSKNCTTFPRIPCSIVAR